MDFHSRISLALVLFVVVIVDGDVRFTTLKNLNSEGPCSFLNPTGYCKNVSLGERKCVKGVCKGECSPSNGNGFCYDDIFGTKRKCIDGRCKGRCSIYNQDGYCDSFLNVEKCTDGRCREKCSSTRKDGFCENDGFSLLKRCVDGKCREMCSFLEKKGYCEQFDMRCKDGWCERQSYADTTTSTTSMPLWSKILFAIGSIIVALLVKFFCRDMCRRIWSSETVVHITPQTTAPRNVTTFPRQGEQFLAQPQTYPEQVVQPPPYPLDNGQGVKSFQADQAVCKSPPAHQLQQPWWEQTTTPSVLETQPPYNSHNQPPPYNTLQLTQPSHHN